ncbi:MAG: hypothetical protein HW380_1940 [Magnetococcales bacterium]|nr:hypothetical protein [Magnetococcales bacterium]
MWRRMFGKFGKVYLEEEISMSATIAFDTYAYVKKLRDAGVDERQAEIQAEALVALVEDRLATKQDIFALKRDLADVEANLRRDIREMDGKIETTKVEILARVDTKIETAKVDTIKWTAGMFAAQTALILGAMFAMLKMNQPNPQPTGSPLPSAQEMRLPAPSTPMPVVPHTR